MPWHDVHVRWVPSTWVHTGCERWPPVIGVVPPPWQYVLLHAVPFHDAPTPASAPNVSSAGSGVSTWPRSAVAIGILWHWSQAIGACQVEVVVMCAAWAPTPRSVVATPPVVSLGGADWPASPWHASHAVAWLTWTVPSMCSSG
jgi:hypothetical protein